MYGLRDYCPFCDDVYVRLLMVTVHFYRTYIYGSSSQATPLVVDNTCHLPSIVSSFIKIFTGLPM